MFIIFFLSKDLAPINVLCIFLDSSLKARIPIDIKFDDLTVMYWLINTARFKIFDYDNFIGNIDIKASLQDNSILKCSCEDLIL